MKMKDIKKLFIGLFIFTLLSVSFLAIAQESADETESADEESSKQVEVTSEELDGEEFKLMIETPSSSVSTNPITEKEVSVSGYIITEEEVPEAINSLVLDSLNQIDSILESYNPAADEESSKQVEVTSEADETEVSEFIPNEEVPEAINSLVLDSLNQIDSILESYNPAADEESSKQVEVTSEADETEVSEFIPNEELPEAINSLVLDSMNQIDSILESQEDIALNINAILNMNTDKKEELFFKYHVVEAIESYQEVNRALGLDHDNSIYVAVPAAAALLYATRKAAQFGKGAARLMTPDKRLPIEEIRRNDLHNYISKRNMLDTLANEQASIRAVQIRLDKKEISLEERKEVLEKQNKDLEARQKSISDGSQVDLELEQSNLKKAQANLRRAQTNFEKQTEASKTKNSLTEAEQAKLKKAQSSVEKAQTNVKEQTAALETKKNSLTKTEHAHLYGAKSNLKSEQIELEVKRSNLKTEQVESEETRRINDAEMRKVEGEMKKAKIQLENQRFRFNSLHKAGRLLRGVGLGVITIAGVSAYAVLAGDLVYITFDKFSDMDALKDRYNSDIQDIISSAQ